MKVVTAKKIVEKVYKEEVTVKHLAVSKQDLLKWLSAEAARELAYQTLLEDTQNDFETVSPSLWIDCLLRWDKTPQGPEYWQNVSERWYKFLECIRLTSQAEDIVSQKREITRGSEQD